MKNHFRIISVIILVLATAFFTGCYSEKNSPLYNSEWIMQNYDNQGQLYYHQLVFQPGNKVALKVMYAESSSELEWTGKYKINSKKVTLDFTDCNRYENEQLSATLTSTKMIRYYAGEFFYSVETFDTDGDTASILELNRPKNYFYGENKDIFGNKMEKFVKVD